MSGDTTRVHTLDVLRGLAASAVVLNHTLRCVPGLDAAGFWESAAGHQPWVRWVFLGDFAVTMFFVLSGASLAISQEQHGEADWRAFYRRRLLRIYPLYAATILAYWAARPLYAFLAPHAGADWLSEQFTAPVPGHAWVTYFSMTQNLFGPRDLFNNALWSLPVEAQFYLGFPVAWVLLKRRPGWRGALGVVLLAGATFVIARKLSLPGKSLERFWEFAGGMLLGAHWQLVARFLRRRAAGYAVGLAALACFAVGRLALPTGRLPANFFDVLAAFGILGLGIGMGFWKPSGRWGALLARIGTWSYALYLAHNLFLGIASPLVGRMHLPVWLHASVLFAVVYTITVALSAASFQYFERPLMRLGRKVAAS